jgi:hypothetical protein
MPIGYLYSDMFPRLANDRTTSSVVGYLDLRRELLDGNSALSVTLPHRLDRFLRQSRPRNILASWLSILLYLVGHVVSLGSEKEMGGIDTGRVIATMQNKQTVRDGADKEFVGNSACKNHTPIASADPDCPITAWVYATRPKNTSLLCFAAYVAEKAINQGNGLPGVLTRLGAESTLTVFECRGINFQRLAADFTIPNDFRNLGSRHDAPRYRFVVFRADRRLATVYPLASLYA